MTTKTVKLRFLKDHEETYIKNKKEETVQFKKGKIYNFSTHGGGYKGYIKGGLAEEVKEQPAKLTDKDLSEIKLSNQQIRDHYLDETVSRTIITHSKELNTFRAGNIDAVIWYDKVKDKVRLWDLSDRGQYERLVRKGRTLYWTLNYFNGLLKEKTVPASLEDKQLGTFQETEGYSLGIDIDGKGEIYDPRVKEAVECMGQFYSDALRKICPKSVFLLFSGGGIYVLIHHSLYYKERDYGAGREILWRRLTGCYNKHIQELQKQFFKKYPQYQGLVKADAINNQKRVFKTIFSVHRRYPFAVVPLDPEHVKINLQDALVPLKDDIKKTGLQWYKNIPKNEDESLRLTEVLKKYEDDLDPKDYEGDDIGTKEPFKLKFKVDQKFFPPCIKKILGLSKVTTGRTRMKTLLAVFLGQLGYSYDEGKKIFDQVSKQLGGPNSNIFKSWFGKMSCPYCKTIKKTGSGFPSLNMGETGVCCPDQICTTIKGPLDYVINASKLGMSGEELKDNIDLVKKNPLVYISNIIATRHTGSEKEAKTVLTGFLYILRTLAEKDGSGILKIGGSSSAGKTHLTRSILECFPKEWVKTLGSISANALKYIEWKNEKILYIQEAGGMGAEDTTEHLKLMDGGDGGFKAGVTVGSPAEGFHTEEIEIPVKFIITTRAEGMFDPQLENRMFSLSIDESEEQTFRVLLHRCKDFAGHTIEGNFDVIRKFVENLQPFDEINVPFSYEFMNILDKKKLRVRRDIDKILSLCQTSAFVNQDKRPVYCSDKKKTLFATPEDAYNVFVLCFPSFEETITGLSKKLQTVYDAIPTDINGITYRDLSKKIGWGKRAVIRTVQDQLDNMGVVEINDSSNKHTVRRVGDLERAVKDFEGYKLNFLLYTAVELCKKFGECDIPLTWFDIDKKIKCDTNCDKLGQKNQSYLKNCDTDCDKTVSNSYQLFKKDELVEKFNNKEKLTITHFCHGFVTLFVTLPQQEKQVISFKYCDNCDNCDTTYSEVPDFKLEIDLSTVTPRHGDTPPDEPPKPPLNDKIKDAIRIIQEHPDDNYSLIADKYGDTFIEQCIKDRLFHEEYCGVKLKFLGGN